jgi:prephenate dehydrogenase
LNAFKWLAGEMPLTPLTSVAVLGLGLIGGSVLRRAGMAIGYDADPATRAAARAAGYRVTDTAAEAAAAADLVILAVPMPALPSVMAELKPYAGLLSDVTSVKAPVRALAAELCPDARWIGGHPMAGREQSGFAAADPELFAGCAWVLCLENDTHLGDWLSVAALVTGWGARVVPVPARRHDTAVAQVSHAPHLAATALAEAAGDPLALALAAGSFRDGTRVAATRPELTAAMCAGNAAALRTELDALIARLERARTLLDKPDSLGPLTAWLSPGHSVRAAWPGSGGPPFAMVPGREELLELGSSGGWVSSVAVDGRSVTAVRPKF